MSMNPKRCDVCGLSVYLLSLMDGISKGVPMKKVTFAALGHLWICEICQMHFEAAGIANDWKLLPDGPLRKAFEDEAERRKAQS